MKCRLTVELSSQPVHLEGWHVSIKTNTMSMRNIVKMGSLMNVCSGQRQQLLSFPAGFLLSCLELVASSEVALALVQEDEFPIYISDHQENKIKTQMWKCKDCNRLYSIFIMSGILCHRCFLIVFLYIVWLDWLSMSRDFQQLRIYSFVLIV